MARDRVDTRKKPVFADAPLMPGQGPTWHACTPVGKQPGFRWRGEGKRNASPPMPRPLCRRVRQNCAIAGSNARTCGLDKAARPPGRYPIVSEAGPAGSVRNAQGATGQLAETVPPAIERSSKLLVSGLLVAGVACVRLAPSMAKDVRRDQMPYQDGEVGTRSGCSCSDIIPEPYREICIVQPQNPIP